MMYEEERPVEIGEVLMKRYRWIPVSLLLAVAVCMGGCGEDRTATKETVKESETKETQPQTSAPAVKVEEKATESEAPKLITSVEYTSKDGTVKITLPDNTWKGTQDADEMRVFSSGSDAMINIVHASTESAMKTLSIQKTKEDLEAALTKQYSDSNAYEIQSFETKKVGDVDLYRYVVKYNAAARMWAYSVTYGVVAQDQAYVITGTVTDDNNALLEAVEDSVDSFMVLKDEELKNITAMTTVAGTTDTGDTAGTPANSTSAQENTSLASYASSSVMYATDTVNVRSGPGTDSEIIGGYTPGDPVTVTGETNGWYQINANGKTGYIRKDLLSTAQTQTQTQTQTGQTDAQSAAVPTDAEASAEAATATSYGSAVTMYAADGVNVRSQPSTGSDVSNTLGLGTAVTVVGETPNWYVVSTGSGTGYISKGLLSSSAPAGGTSSSSGQTGQDQYSEDTGSTSTSSGLSGSGYLSGVVTDSSGDSITIAGDDGNTYTIYTGTAEISASEGLYDGLYVNVGYSMGSDGSISASTVTG